MSSASSLPITFVLKTIFYVKESYSSYDYVQKPLYVLHRKEVEGYKDVHEFDVDNGGSPHAKFQRETVEEDKNLYRIRCCYNKRYWSFSSNGFLQATETTAEQATLFEFEALRGQDKIMYRLKCPQLQQYISTDRDLGLLKAEDAMKQSPEEFTVVDWESVLILPKEVAFKADNGKYICVRYSPHTDEYTYLKAECSDIGDATVGNQIETLSDGKTVVKNKYTTKYWTCDDGWHREHSKTYPIYMVATSDDTNKAESQFSAIKIDRDSIALRNIGRGSYCVRSKDWLICNLDQRATISKEAHLRVEEPVVSRKIYDVDFKFDESFIYNEDRYVTTDKCTNDLSDRHIDKLKLECKKAITSTYDTADTVRTSNTFSLEFSVPFLRDYVTITGKGQYITEEEHKYAWGEAKRTNFEVSCLMKVTVKGKTKVVAEMEATKAKCDIPFSYTQRDLLTSGEHIVQTKDDGVYSCENYFNFNIRIKEEKLA